MVINLAQDDDPNRRPGVGKTQGQCTLRHPLQLTHRIGVPPEAHSIGGGPKRNSTEVAREVAGGVGRIQPERVTMGVEPKGLWAQRPRIELRLIHHPIATGRNSSSVWYPIFLRLAALIRQKPSTDIHSHSPRIK